MKSKWYVVRFITEKHYLDAIVGEYRHFESARKAADRWNIEAAEAALKGGYDRPVYTFAVVEGVGRPFASLSTAQVNP